MSNKSRPSRGCFMCRTRRIKCDGAKPQCRNCQKRNRQCPGYPNDLDPKSPEISKATERKFLRPAHTRSSVSPTSIPQSLTIPIDQQSSCFFVSNFVLSPHQAIIREGYMHFLIPMLEAEDPKSHLSVAFSAVSLAALGNKWNAKALFRKATSLYTTALQQINLALCNEDLASLDSTIAAVFLLGIFEGLTSPRVSAMVSHIDGAIALLKLRGEQQLETPVSRQLFLAIRQQMTVNCMGLWKAPKFGVDWWMKSVGEDDFGKVVADLNLKVAELQEDCNEILTSAPHTPANFEKVLKLKQRAEALEHMYIDWSKSPPEIWRYKTMAWADRVRDADLATANVYPGKVDMYGDICIANTWNLSRVSRLLASGVVLRCTAWLLAPDDYRITPEYAKASQLGVDLISDIIASLPYFCGWRHRHGAGPDDLLELDFKDDYGRSTRRARRHVPHLAATHGCKL